MISWELMDPDDSSENSPIPRGCPLDNVLRLPSGEWTPHIVGLLGRKGPPRQTHSRKALNGISSKVLTDRLRMSEQERIVYRQYEPTVPPKVTYGLTDFGRQVDDAFQAFEPIVDAWPGRHRPALDTGG